MSIDYTFYEFFAGGGLARLGLGDRWRCLLANDVSEKKGAAYRANFLESHELVIDDVRNLKVAELPLDGTLAWASFPCQDLSLAGNGEGIHAERSGAFWPFWRLMIDMQQEGHKVPLIVLENVAGLLTSGKGADFETLCRVVVQAGYQLGAVVINAELFVPQSRPRLFIVAVDSGWRLPPQVTQPSAVGPWFPKHLKRTHKQLPRALQSNWIWWNLPIPQERQTTLLDLIEAEPVGVEWHSEAETARLLALMSELNLRKVHAAQQSGVRQVGAIYRRTRKEAGKSVLRAEVRFDGKSGCLRTPAGGSSRQIILIVDGEHIRSRLLSPREAARLMGLEDAYVLPSGYNDAYHLMGDAVAVPAVRWLEKHILHPIIQFQNQAQNVDSSNPLELSLEQAQAWPVKQLSLVNY